MERERNFTYSECECKLNDKKNFDTLYVTSMNQQSMIKKHFLNFKNIFLFVINFDILYVTSMNFNDKKKLRYESLVYETLFDTFIGDPLNTLNEQSKPINLFKGHYIY
jgi:hypothetical protein